MIPNRKNLQPKRQIFLTLVLILYFIGSSYSDAAAAGTTYYVDNTNSSCSDAALGTTTALPFCTIGKAASIAIAGDTVRVLAGSYAETVNGANSGSTGLPITYSGAPGVTVNGNGLVNGGNAFRITSESYIIVDGFTITGTADYGIYVWGSNNVTITNNHVSDAGSPVSGSTRAGIYVNSSTNSTISGNTSDHNSSHGIHLTNGANNNLVSNNLAFANAQQWQRNANGIRLDASHNNTILHNITYANEDSGLNIYTGSSGNYLLGNLTYGNGDHGIDFLNSPNNIVTGNTVQGNHTAGLNFEGSSAPASSGATIRNNISVDNGIAPITGQKSNIRVDALSTTGTTLDYDIVYLSGAGTVEILWNGVGYATLAAFQAAVPGQEVHGIQSTPLFVSPVAYATRPPAIVLGDYHIQAGSPAIDSANSNASNEPTVDIEGNLRVDDPSTTNTGAGTRTYDDRGAYEFQVASVLPIVTTEAVSNITGLTATGNGNITDLGVPNPTAHGVVWSTALNPTTADNVTDLGAASTTGAFSAPITGLTPGTLYHVRAFATNTAGTSYGAEVTFTTLLIPTVTTQAVSAIGGTTATGNGNITELGVPNPTAYGVVWSTTLNPTTADNISDLGATAATGAFTAPITGLTPGTLYHVRAFATNTAGTSYGADVSFMTLLTPTVTTQAVSTITTTSATGNGTITDLGVPTPTAYGVVWNTTGSPTTADNFTNEGATSTTGAFTSLMTGLPQNILIYVRAYATNSAGTAYGNEVTFTIDTTAPTVTTNLTTNYTGVGPGSFIATFSKAVDDPAGNTDIDDVTNPVNYLLVNKGTNGSIDTVSCAGDVIADDTQVTVTSVIYNSATFQAIVTLVSPLPVGSYRLFICGTTSIVDLAGNPLNGGTDYTFDFVVKAAQPGGSGSGKGGNTKLGSLLPATGFPQDRVSILPIHPADKAYTSTDVWLEIPNLGVKMPIVGVPSTKGGWDTSWLGKNAGWLNGSAFPTWNGNSVLSGHVWDALNRPGPFAQLKSLTYGDHIEIHAFGLIYTYEVTESSLITDADVKKAFKHEDKSVITLLTCEGYQETSQIYSYRRMVRAVLVSVVKDK